MKLLLQLKLVNFPGELLLTINLLLHTVKNGVPITEEELRKGSHFLLLERHFSEQIFSPYIERSRYDSSFEYIYKSAYSGMAG